MTNDAEPERAELELIEKELTETARQAGLVYCEDCRKLSYIEQKVCKCCGSRLHSRFANSINRCWALTLSATLLLIPANILPIMTVKSFNQGEPDTIMSGIISLFQHGLYPIGVIVFLASIMVPFLKIIGLILLMLSVQGNIEMGRRERTRMYRIVEFFGKWSMLDVFVVSLLVALVEIGEIASVDAGLGVTAFCSMVILTMFAANSFDSRLIWDNVQQQDISTGKLEN